MKSKLSKNHKPDYSIVIPAYNEAKYIAKTLKSLQKQDYKGNVEIIVVDNNSTDKTVYIASKTGAKVLKEENIGVCWARQTGTAYASGKIIISTDADTIFAKDWLSNIDKSFKQNPNLIAVGGTCHFVNAPYWGKLFETSLYGLVSVIYKLTGKIVHFCAANIAFKKSAWDGYNTNLTQGGDELDLLRKMKKKGPIHYDSQNPVFTSSRRLTRGLIYNIFVTFLTYYVIEYNLSRIFKRPVLGGYPKFRDNHSLKTGLFVRLFMLFFVITTIVLLSKNRLHPNIVYGSKIVKSIIALNPL